MLTRSAVHPMPTPDTHSHHQRCRTLSSDGGASALVTANTGQVIEFLDGSIEPYRPGVSDQVQKRKTKRGIDARIEEQESLRTKKKHRENNVHYAQAEPSAAFIMPSAIYLSPPTCVDGSGSSTCAKRWIDRFNLSKLKLLNAPGKKTRKVQSTLTVERTATGTTPYTPIRCIYLCTFSALCVVDVVCGSSARTSSTTRSPPSSPTLPPPPPPPPPDRALPLPGPSASGATAASAAAGGGVVIVYLGGLPNPSYTGKISLSPSTSSTSSCARRPYASMSAARVVLAVLLVAIATGYGRRWVGRG